MSDTLTVFSYTNVYGISINYANIYCNIVIKLTNINTLVLAKCNNVNILLNLWYNSYGGYRRGIRLIKPDN